MAHKRSLEKQAARQERSQQYREARKLVTSNSYHDRMLAESVCLTSPGQLSDHLKSKFESVLPCVTARYERGEVLTDKKGTGSLQNPDRGSEKRDWALALDINE